MLEIVYQDEHFVAINKPHGLLVHRTKIAEEKVYFALQMLRDQLGQRVYPLHRLDRKTSGILLFGLSSEAAKLLSKAFVNHEITKTYYAIVRGFAPEKGTIDKPLKSENGNIQVAETKFETLQKVTLPIPFGKYPTCRYSFVKIEPKTGRMHQIRRHFNYINCPIIGDYKHGDYRHNRLFIERYNVSEMLLHAADMKFEQPFTKEKITIKADFQTSFQTVLNELFID